MPIRVSRNSTLFDYLPELARHFEDAYALLAQGRWTDEVVLRQHNGKPFRRRLWVQYAYFPSGWREWGRGERHMADERVPWGLLEAALFKPHHWLDSRRASDFCEWFDAPSARAVLGAFAGFCASGGLPDGDPRACGGRVRGHLEERLPPSSLPGVDPLALRVFAELLADKDDVDQPRFGPPGSGMGFVRELHRRLEKGGAYEKDGGEGERRRVPKERIPAQVRALVFSTYLPDVDPYDVATAFCLEAMAFLRVATGGRVDELDERALAHRLADFEHTIRSSLDGSHNRATTLGEVSDLILEVVYGGRKPELGNAPDYSKYLKAASLSVDYGWDESRIARALGSKKIRGDSRAPTASAEARARHYVTEGKKIRAAIPDSMFADTV